MDVAAARRKTAGLSSLIGNLDIDDLPPDGQQAAGERPPEPQGNAQPAPEPAPPVSKRQAAKPRKSAPRQRKPKPPPAPAEPKYLRMVRREARMTEQQANTLDALTRRLDRARRRRGERLTWNTLNRIAVDLLLARADDLAGTTEDELRESLGLGVTDSQSR